MHLKLRRGLTATAAIVLALAASAAWTPQRAAAADCPPVGASYSNVVNGSDAAEVLGGTTGADLILAGGGDDQIFGWSGNDIVCGGGGRDVVYYYATAQAPSGFTEDINLAAGTATGTAGNDTLIDVEDAFGSDYNDRIVGSSEGNFLYGGEGDDQISGGDGRDVIFGDGSADIDVMNPEGSDVIHGDGGSDYINANGGADQLYGDAGDDQLNGEGGGDLLNGGENDDYAYYACSYLSPFCAGYSGPGVNVNLTTGVVSGGQGNDTIAAGSDGKSTVENVIGSGFDDTLTGASGQVNTLQPRLGADTVVGNDDGDYVDFNCIGNDEVTPCGGYAGTIVNLATNSATGPQGTDTLLHLQGVNGSPNSDQITGSTDSNELLGGKGDDSINGGDGDDGIVGGDGDDRMNGGGGEADRLRFDLLSCSGSGIDVRLAGGTALGEGNDTLDGFEQVIGSPCNDTLVGSNQHDNLLGYGGADTLYGRGGDDLLVPYVSQVGDGGAVGANGNDSVFGGDGFDEISYAGAADGVVADLSSGQVSSDGDGGSDQVSGVEVVRGSHTDDELAGTSGRDMLLGALGDDIIRGSGGDDYLDGDAGNDLIYGGAGPDAVDYTQSASRVEVNLQKRSAIEFYAGEGGTEISADYLDQIETVAGTDGNDKLIGSKRSDALFGEGGNDGTMLGSNGDDLLLGGGPAPSEAGKQSFDGGNGRDYCFGGKKAKRCERRKPDPEKLKESKKPQPLQFMTVMRDFRTTGTNNLNLLDDGLDLMKVRKLVAPPFATPPSPP